MEKCSLVAPGFCLVLAKAQGASFLTVNWAYLEPQVPCVLAWKLIVPMIARARILEASYANMRTIWGTDSTASLSH